MGAGGGGSAWWISGHGSLSAGCLSFEPGLRTSRVGQMVPYIYSSWPILVFTGEEIAISDKLTMHPEPEVHDVTIGHMDIISHVLRLCMCFKRNISNWQKKNEHQNLR